MILGKVMSGADVTEVYSPPRIAASCLEAGLVGGSSFDLRTGWDLSNQKMVLQTVMKAVGWISPMHVVFQVAKPQPRSAERAVETRIL